MTPVKTIERLIIYRTILEQNAAQGVTQLFSKDLAAQTGNNPAQVRRDLMTVGYFGNPQKGYIVKDLLKQIKVLLEPEEGISITIVGIGNLGRAIMGYFSSNDQKIRLIAAFDNDDYKINRVIAGCNCYHIREIGEVLRPHKVQLGIITVPGNHAQQTADTLIAAGVQGIVNFAPLPVKTPSHIYVENIDITKTLEKAAFFTRLQSGDTIREGVENRSFSNAI
jgi:redox-sensing transcriptional repressor